MRLEPRGPYSSEASWRAARRASAIAVHIGFTPGHSGKTPVSAIQRFSTSWQRPRESTTPCAGSPCMRIMPGVFGLPEEIGSLEEAREALRGRALRPGDFVTAGNHAFCTTRMHGDASLGVVDEFGRCHDLDNLFIADTGIFPRCTGVNPMFTGMALAHRATERVLEVV